MKQRLFLSTFMFLFTFGIFASSAFAADPPTKPDPAKDLLSGWSLKDSDVIMSLESSKTKKEVFVFDRARLNFTKPFTLFENNAGVRIALDSFFDNTSKKQEFTLKYAYPWIQLTPEIRAKIGYIEGVLVNPEEMGLRNLGGHMGKSLLDADLGISSSRLAAGLDYQLNAKSKLSVIGGNGIFGDHSMEAALDYYPFTHMSDSIMQYFFVKGGALYDFGGLNKDTTLWMGRTGFYNKNVYEISAMALTTHGPANRLKGLYPGLSALKDAQISNTAFEVLGRVYPFKLVMSGNKDLEKAWLMGRVRDISGDFGYRNTAIIVGYDLTDSIRINAGPEWNHYSHETGKAGSETRMVIGIGLKF